jgi:hypothetical protein
VGIKGYTTALQTIQTLKEACKLQLHRHSLAAISDRSMVLSAAVLPHHYREVKGRPVYVRKPDPPNPADSCASFEVYRALQMFKSEKGSDCGQVF